MKNLLKSEVKIWVQYFVIALIAGWLHFQLYFASIPHLNLEEAWKNYEPLLRQWLVLFTLISALRLSFLLLVHRLSKAG